ncbi:EamA family transporter [Oscillatoria sp. FACHB-1406]|uniref:EamA family transporter n=1 Tax=Oscillatoria sp. FACHB-1406 TaxID=2692846 RepID=UPI001685A841|nr:EamA family transporter [Oscillatoria sp. FACHB-1406]MBD2579295.1 EamA family transporter [Oscillatoria sp. FACHB-1406]
MIDRIAKLFALPPISLVLLAIASTQIGSAFAKSLLPSIGSFGMVLMRVGFAAVILMVFCQPKWTPTIQQNFKLLIGFGLVLSLMNLSFYLAIERIPLGIAVALEFTGPLGLAALKSRGKLTLLWVLLAAIGVALLTPLSGERLNLLGVCFALTAAFFWAMYIILSARVGQVVAGIEGLCWAMLVGAIWLVPVGIFTAGNALLQPRLLLSGFGVAILSSMIPYSLEMIALKSLPIDLFGILKSLDPMSAAVAGFLVLGERLTGQSIVAIVSISLAAAGASRFREDIVRTSQK